MLTAEARRVGYVGRPDQWPQSGEHADHVLASQRIDQVLVRLGEHVVDVGAARHDPIGAPRPWSVRVADQPAGVRRDHEQHALLGPREQPRRHLYPIERDDDVDPLRGPHLGVEVRTGAGADAIGPGADGTRDGAGRDRQNLPRLLVEDLRADDPSARPRQLDDASAIRDPGAVRGRRPRDDRDHPCIVLGGVVELHRPGKALATEAGVLGERAAASEMTVPRYRTRPADRVVEDEAGPEVRPLPAPAAQRPQEGDG